MGLLFCSAHGHLACPPRWWQVCGRQEYGVVSYERGGILGMWSSWPKEFTKIVHLKLICYCKSIVLRLKKKKRKLYKFLSQFSKKKKKAVEEKIWLDVLFYVYTIKLQMANFTWPDIYSHFPVYSWCYGLNMYPLQNHMLES